jgi:hypothetical protein
VSSTIDSSTGGTASEDATRDGDAEPSDAPSVSSDALSDAGIPDAGIPGIIQVGVCANIDSFDGSCGDPRTDLGSDPHNCASCGNDCMGGACNAGACVQLPANTLATGQHAPIALAADGRNVYWLNWGMTGTTGTGGGKRPVISVLSAQVLECAVGGCNNRPTVLATLPAAGEVGGLPLAPSALAVDSTNVYWTTGDSVLTCAIGGCGCSPTVVVGGLTQPPGVTVAAGRLFWSVWANGSPYTGQVQTCTTTGCANVTTLAGGQGGPLGLTADDSNVYWADTYGPNGGGSISACAVAGCNGAPTLMSAVGTPDGNPRNLTSDATRLFWTDGTGGIVQCAKADCAGTQITLVAGHNNLDVGAIAIDATDVYWRDTNIYKCAIDGCNGTPTLVATASADSFQWDGTLAVDATRVYWTESGATTDDDRIVWAAK